MKKTLALFLSLVLLLGAAACGSTTDTGDKGNDTPPATEAPEQTPAGTQETPEPTEEPGEASESGEEPAENPEGAAAALEEEYYGEDSRPRVIVTTDLECDDMNSLIHMALFFDELDMAGIVYSASQYHFIGDGEHTLGEINPNFCCLDADAAELTSYRPMEIGWIEDLWSNEYAEVYPFLSENDPRYPAPEELLEITKVGNVEFEGDVRFATEGSDLIKDAMLDGDMRPLYVMSWGGFNTVARALLSIAEEYQDTELWEEVYDRVTRKTVISGYTQDFAYRDHIHDLYPDLLLMGTTNAYGAYFAAQNSQPDVLDMFKSDWMKENIKFDHGALMSKYGLFGDGTYYEGETPENQFGEVLVIDWGWGFAYYYDQYDFLGEGDSNGYIALLDFGLRGLTEPAATTASGKVSYTTDGDTRSFSEMVFNPLPVEIVDYNPVTGAATNDSGRYIKAYQEEFAARADWCVSAYEDCNHAPVVTAEALDLSAAPGQSVALSAAVEDPDGDAFTAYWWVDEQNAAYSGSSKSLQVWDPVSLSTRFTVPADALPGDCFCITLQVRDQAEAPMTRYAQVIVTVVEAEEEPVEEPVEEPAEEPAEGEEAVEEPAEEPAEGEEAGEEAGEAAEEPAEEAGEEAAADGKTVTAKTYVSDSGLMLTDIVFTHPKDYDGDALSPEDFVLTYTVAPNPYAGVTEPYDEEGEILAVTAEGNCVDLQVAETAYNKQNIVVSCENELLCAEMKDFVREAPIVDEFVHDTFTSSEGVEISYFLYLPEEDNAPLMVWEHGGGEVLASAAEGANLTANRGAVAWVEADQGSAVLSVQYPENYSFGISELPEELEAMERFNTAKYELICQLIEEGKIDGARVYGSGASSGGGGILRFAMQYPELFAKVVAICAKDTVVPLSQKYELAYQMSDPSLLKLSDETVEEELDNMLAVLEGNGIVNVPIWFVHAENDPVCTSYTSQLMYAALEELGAENNRLTLYSDEEMQAAGQSFFHSAWVPALRDAEIIDWVYD